MSWLCRCLGITLQVELFWHLRVCSRLSLCLPQAPFGPILPVFLCTGVQSWLYRPGALWRHALTKTVMFCPAVCARIQFLQRFCSRVTSLVTSALYDGIGYVTPPKNSFNIECARIPPGRKRALPQICKQRAPGLYKPSVSRPRAVFGPKPKCLGEIYVGRPQSTISSEWSIWMQNTVPTKQLHLVIKSIQRCRHIIWNEKSFRPRANHGKRQKCRHFGRDICW